MGRITYIVISLLVAGGCATDGGERDRTSTGAAVGAVTGAILGSQVDEDKRTRGAVVGGVLGGAVGAAIGKQMDQQEKEYRRALEQERAQNEVQVTRVREDLLQLTLANEVTFDFDSATIRPGFTRSLDKIAQIMAKYPDTRITVVGHTDSIGSEIYNQQLSERRASSVAGYLSAQGVADYRVNTLGRGEAEPKATNATESGRRANRRVDIYVQPEQTTG